MDVDPLGVEGWAAVSVDRLGVAVVLVAGVVVRVGDHRGTISFGNVEKSRQRRSRPFAGPSGSQTCRSSRRSRSRTVSTLRASK